MVIQWSVKSPSSVCLLLISILVIYVIYFPFLVSWSLVLVPSVIGLRSLCTSAAAACLLLLLIDEPWCCRVDYAMLPCPDLGVLPTCTWSIWLALGCPTLWSGTWLPNTSTWYPIGTWVPNTCSGQPGCTYSSISLDELHTGCDLLCDIYSLSDPVVTCDALWTYHSSCTWSGWTVYISSMLSTTFHAHEHCYCLHVSLLAHMLIRTSPCSIPCIHHLYVICQHCIICHDVTVLYANVLVSDLWCSQSPFIVM